MAYEIKTKKSGFTICSNSKQVKFLLLLKLNLDVTKVMRVSLDKHSWAEREKQNLNLKSLIIMATLQQSASGKKTEISYFIYRETTNKNIVVSKNQVKYIDYKDGDFIEIEQGKFFLVVFTIHEIPKKSFSSCKRARHLANAICS
jgi:hypothetical protein